MWTNMPGICWRFDIVGWNPRCFCHPVKEWYRCDAIGPVPFWYIFLRIRRRHEWRSLAFLSSIFHHNLMQLSFQLQQTKYNSRLKQHLQIAFQVDTKKVQVIKTSASTKGKPILFSVRQKMIICHHQVQVSILFCTAWIGAAWRHRLVLNLPRSCHLMLICYDVGLEQSDYCEASVLCVSRIAVHCRRWRHLFQNPAFSCSHARLFSSYIHIRFHKCEAENVQISRFRSSKR